MTARYPRQLRARSQQCASSKSAVVPAPVHCLALVLQLLLLSSAALRVTSQFQSRTARVAFDARGLQGYLNDDTVEDIIIGGDIQLNPSNWFDMSSIGRSVVLEGNPPDRRWALDLGAIVNAIHILPEGSVEFRNLAVQGAAPVQAVEPLQLAMLPQQIGSAIWPSVVTETNATIVYNNSDLSFSEPVPGASCLQYNAQAGLALNTSSIDFVPSADGRSLYLPGENVFPEPVRLLSSNTLLGNATLLSIDSSQTCIEFLAPTLAPSPGPAGLGAVPSSQSGGSGGLSGGGIAGIVVGAVVAAALAAGLIGVFVWRQARARRDVQQVSSPGVSKSLRSTASETTGSTSAGVHKHPDTDRDSSDPIQRFMASKYSYDTSSSVLSTRSSQGSMMQFEWRIDPGRLSIVRRPNGKPHKLGAGGCGTVYKALLDDVMEVAVKFLKNEGAEGVATNLRQFASEVDIMRACRDPHIVNFLGAWIDQSEGVAYLVQEYLEEGDLASALSNPQRAPEFTWSNRGKLTALDIAQGLHYLHSNNIIHFDIKSANCLLDKAKTAKLADVGLSHALTSKSHLSVDAMRGTFAYASPEVMTGTACTFKTDVWSFGVLLWELISCERPQRGRYRTLRIPSECPQEIGALVDACMQTNPDDRPTAKEVVQILLQHVRQ